MARRNRKNHLTPRKPNRKTGKKPKIPKDMIEARVYMPRSTHQLWMLASTAVGLSLSEWVIGRVEDALGKLSRKAPEESSAPETKASARLREITDAAAKLDLEAQTVLLRVAALMQARAEHEPPR